MPHQPCRPAAVVPPDILRVLRGVGLLLLWIGALYLARETASARGLLSTATPMAEGALVVAGCSELIVNGGFEVTGTGWTSVESNLPPAYSAAQAFSGNQSMHIGNTDRPNTPGVSVVQQTVTLPGSAASIVLGFQYYPIHESAPDNDRQYMDIYDAYTNEPIARPWEELSNARRWIFLQYDLTALRGRTVRLGFAVINDGGGGRTALYLDDVSVMACDVGPGVTPTSTPVTGTPTPTPPVSVIATATPTATSTPTPTLTPTSSPTPTRRPGCVTDYIQNGDFESTGGWTFGNSPTTPGYSAEQSHGTGLRSMRLGNPPGPGTLNTTSYSSARQLISLPGNAGTARLSWWHYSRTEEPENATPNRWQDRQDVILLKTNLSTRAILYRARLNTGDWREGSADLTPYLGESVYIYFNVFNDNNSQRTWMYLDDAALTICYPGVTATPAATARPASVATEIPATATPTPTEAGAAGMGEPKGGLEAEAGAVGTPVERPILEVTPTVSNRGIVGAVTPRGSVPRSPETPTPAFTPTPQPAGGLLGFVGNYLWLILIVVVVAVVGILWYLGLLRWPGA